MSSPLIELEDVSVVRSGVPILKRLSLQIHEGQHTVILGPNGCGKSTLIKLLTREIYPYAGQGAVRILGEDSWLQRDLRRSLGVVSAEPKEPLLGDPTALELAVSGLLGTHGVIWSYEVTDQMWSKARQALAAVEALHLADRDVTTLSAGEHRRVLIARALVNEPRALVLDEPTTSLDLVAATRFLQTLRSVAQENRTLLLVTHHLEEVIPEFQRVILLRRGEIIADGPVESVLTEENLTELFESPIRRSLDSSYRARIVPTDSLCHS